MLAINNLVRVKEWQLIHSYIYLSIRDINRSNSNCDKSKLHRLLIVRLDPSLLFQSRLGESPNLQCLLGVLVQIPPPPAASFMIQRAADVIKGRILR